MQYYDNNSGSLKQKQHMKEYLFSIKVNSENNHINDDDDDNNNDENHENDIENNVNSYKKKSGFIEKQIVNKFKNLFYYYTN